MTVHDEVAAAQEVVREWEARRRANGHGEPPGDDVTAASGECNGENPLLAEALKYAARGRPVVQLHGIVDGRCTCPEGQRGEPCKKPGKPGKHPCIGGRHPKKGKGGVYCGTTNEETIRLWWRARPRGNVALPLGGGLHGIDVDGPDGEDALSALERMHGKLPPTLEAKSGRPDGGRHLYFSIPTDLELGSHDLAPHINTRGTGGFLVAPPSAHESGATYAWVHKCAPAPMPQWMLAILIAKAEANGTAAAAGGATDGNVTPGISERIGKLLERDEAFRELWEGRGKTEGDRSRSGYDASITAYLKLRGASDAEIVAAIAARPDAHRRDSNYAARTVASVGGYVDGNGAGSGYAPPRKKPAGRAPILLGDNLSEIVDEAIEALAALDVFQREGALVDVVRTATLDEQQVMRPDGTPRIRFLPTARLRELLSIACEFQKRTQQEDDSWTTRSVPVPTEVVSTLAARGQWAHIRRLAGVAECPVIRPDGSLLDTPGYDVRTGLIFEGEPVNVSATPTNEEARGAIKVLHDLVCDFPFSTDAHRSAWLATLLTPLARPAIDGPTPLGLFDAAERGSGKTLLADLLGVILNGKPLPRRTAPTEQDEWRKAMLAIAIAADPIILIDNVTRMLRSDALDAVLTGTAFRERVLGKNEELTLDVRTLFIVTSNNATLSADLVRRSLHVRLEAQEERPEKRTGFTHPHLLEHARECRPLYLAAGLTILRAYICAGRPEVELQPMGSYEAWSSIVRAALVWAGEPDPAETQEGLREASDPEDEQIAALLPAWLAVYQERVRTVREVLTDVGGDEDRLGATHAALRDAICSYCDTDAGKLPTPRRLGNALAKLRGKIRGRLIFERPTEKGKHGARWRVRTIGESQGS